MTRVSAGSRSVYRRGRAPHVDLSREPQEPTRSTVLSREKYERERAKREARWARDATLRDPNKA